MFNGLCVVNVLIKCNGNVYDLSTYLTSNLKNSQFIKKIITFHYFQRIIVELGVKVFKK